MVGERTGDRGKLVRSGVQARCVHQAAREPDGALVQRVGEELPHRPELAFRRGSPLLVSHHRSAKRAVTDERGNVQGRAGRVHALEVLAEAGPVQGQFRGVGAGERRHLCGAGDGERRSSAVADDERRHALTQHRVHRRLDERRDVRVAVDVDESWRHDQARTVDPARGRRLGVVRAEDVLDPVAGDHEGARPGQGPGSVDDQRAGDDEVGHVRVSGRWARSRYPTSAGWPEARTGWRRTARAGGPTR